MTAISEEASGLWQGELRAIVSLVAKAATVNGVSFPDRKRHTRDGVSQATLPSNAGGKRARRFPRLPVEPPVFGMAYRLPARALGRNASGASPWIAGVKTHELFA